MRWGGFVDFLVVARREGEREGEERGGWGCRGRLRRNEEGLVWLVVIQQGVSGDVGHDCFYGFLSFFYFFFCWC